MEYSSPLAAIRPQPHAAWGNSRYVPESRVMYNACAQTLAPSTFDFKAMSMHQTHTNTQPRRRPDYFSLRPVRGSSPTASLTADLGANFHIDKRFGPHSSSLVLISTHNAIRSPQAPTPRRSLFTTDLFKPREDAVTPPVEIEPATTPPIPSSSPYCSAMDISPLPHKIPHFVAQVTLPSPTPDETPSDVIDSLPDPLLPVEPYVPPPLVHAVVPSPTLLQLPERRRPATRPGLSRTKAYSSSVTPSQRTVNTETQLPPFRFGNVALSGLSCSSTPSLLESYTDSPIEDASLPSAVPMLPPPRRPSLSSATRNNGSPSTHHVRKPSAGRSSFVRPQRKLIRRSLSMFQHPDDIMKEEQEPFEPQPSLLSSVMDVEQDHPYKLPFFIPDNEPDSLPRITRETLLDVLDSKYREQYVRVLIIDCRFEYEYEGGHIDNAVNFNDKQLLANELFSDNTPPSNTLLIFHCEYSVHRAPLTAKFIRGHDRNVNAANYPNLTYPEMYILDGGYSKFFAEHPAKCFPQNYVEMNDERHELACERGMAKVKQQRQKLFRHQTFAFGQQHHDDMEDSPTAQSRGMGLRSLSSFTIRTDIAEGIGMSYQRRMASY